MVAWLGLGVKDGLTHMSGGCAGCYSGFSLHTVSHPQEGGGEFLSKRARVKSVRPRLGNHGMSHLPYSIVQFSYQSKSQGQPRFKEKRRKDSIS